MIIVAKRLKQLRKESRQTQAEVAQTIGCCHSAVSSYEAGRNEPPLETMVKLAKCFGVSISFLIGATDNKEWGVVQETISENEISAFLSSRIRELRIEKHVSQEDIGHLIGCGYTAICNYESGRNRLSIEKLIILSEFFGVSAEYMLGLTNSKAAPNGSNGSGIKIFRNERRTSNIENGICVPFPKTEGQETAALQGAKGKEKALSDLHNFIKCNLSREKEDEFWDYLQEYAACLEIESFKDGSAYMAASIEADIKDTQEEIV